MRIWMKYLIVGWSIITAGIILAAFQVMKYDFIKEDYEINEYLKNSELNPSGISLEEELFKDNAFGQWAITKSEFINRIKNSERIHLESNHKVQYRTIYLYLPIYGFIIWSVPIFVFSLLGYLFGKSKNRSSPI